jgi:hypothetical protein
LRTTAWRVAGSWSAIATGLSIGREGPLIEFGGSLGAKVAQVARVSLNEVRVLVAAGTAAGFAAAYNTPFAAVLFVLETIVGIVALDALLPAIAADRSTASVRSPWRLRMSWCRTPHWESWRPAVLSRSKRCWCSVSDSWSGTRCRSRGARPAAVSWWARSPSFCRAWRATGTSR